MCYCIIMTATTFSADTGRGTVTASTDTFTLKSGVTADGSEAEFVEGFLATTHIDKGNDEFTVDALKMMAKDITQDVKNVDAVFNDVDTESLVGNLDHNNNPGAPFGDTRIVPAFKIVDAKVRDTGDGEKGLWIKAKLNTGGMVSDTVSAVKNSIKDNFLNAFSIEFLPQKVKRVTRGEKTVRIIEEAGAKGAALTGRPMNPNASLTDADLKSMAGEFVDKTDDNTMETKQDYTVQTPEYSATSESADWSERPDASSFPDDYNPLNAFIIRNPESDNYSDQSLPVVKMIDGKPTLVLEGLQDAHGVAAQIEGASDEEVQRAKNKIESLAEEEFNFNIGGDNNKKSGTMTMSEDDTPEEEPEDQPEADEAEAKSEGESDGEQEQSVKGDVEELKTQVEEVKERNEDLEEENEELKSELEDLRQLQEIKSEVDEVKELLEDVDLEDGPKARQDQERFESKSGSTGWKDKVDNMPNSFLKSEGKGKSNLDAYAQKISEKHDVSEQEVKDYVNTD